MKSVDHLRLTALYEPGEDGWIYAHVLEIPGINTQGRTRAEAKEMLEDAAREFIASLADEAGRAVHPDTEVETLEIELA